MSESDEGEAWPHEPDQPEEPHTGWPDEPEEFDPESLAPSAPEVPSSDDPDNPEAVRLFLKLVAVFNVALLGLSVGAMFVVFQGQWNLGLQIFFLGALAFAYGSFRYYRFRTSDDQHEQNG